MSCCEMPCKKEISFVIAAFVQENSLHPKMVRYIRTVLQRGKSFEELHHMTKDELWRLLAYFAKDLELTMQQIGVF